MNEIILIKNGELALKGLNRRSFEDLLIKNMRHRLDGLGTFDFTPQQSTVVVTPHEDVTDMDEAFSRLCKVFGIAALSRAASVEKDMNTILRSTAQYLDERILSARTFKVNAKRSDKSFPLASPEICNQVGGYILSRYSHLSVDVHNPDLIITVEIRDSAAYIHGNQVKGAGGMPVGSSGRAALLISGGIDSPVAGYMMAKRGLALTAVHFASPPYTSVKAEQKVHKLLRKVAEYSGRIVLFTVPFTEIQEQIKDNCPEDLFTLIMRRMMMRISQMVAAAQNCGALITGESVGQVASQTMPAIACTQAVCKIPVFRPLIGMDKDEAVAISRKIETFDISILPYEDCCTVFTPKHPRTKPTLEMLEKAEKVLDIDALCEKAFNGIKMKIIHAYNTDGDDANE